MSEMQLSEELSASIEAMKVLKGKKKKQAMQDLVGHTTEESIATFQFLLTDEDKAIRKLAIESIEQWEEEPPQNIYDTFAHALEDAESSVRNAALKKLDLWSMNPALIEPLTALLSTKKVRDILSGYGADVIEPLASLLDSMNMKNAKLALSILSSFGAEAQVAIPEILKLTSTSDKPLRKAAFACLRAVEAQREDVEDAALAAIKDGDKEAAALVQEWGVDAIDVFEALLESDDTKIRVLGLNQMTELSQHLEEDDDYDAIIAVLEDDKPSVRRAALHLFAALPFPVEGVLEKIYSVLDEPEVVDVLLKFGKKALPVFEELVQTERVKMRRNFIQSIAPRLTQEVMDALQTPILDMLQKAYTDDIIRAGFSMIQSFAWLKEEVLKAIEHHQDHYDTEVAKAAREAVEHWGGTARESMWATCHLDSRIIRHLQRLKITFEAPDRSSFENLSEAAQALSDPMFDFMFGLKFPNGSTFETINAYGTTYFRSGEVFEAVKRHSDKEEKITCYVFAETDYRWLGVDVASTGSDPVVYVSEWEGEEGDWGWSSLSYFLQHVVRPD